MRYILVPHTGHAPWVAGRPFLRVTGCGWRISRLCSYRYRVTFATSIMNLEVLSRGEAAFSGSNTQIRPGWTLFRLPAFLLRRGEHLLRPPDGRSTIVGDHRDQGAVFAVGAAPL